jgi:hypothetical protein
MSPASNRIAASPAHTPAPDAACGDALAPAYILNFAAAQKQRDQSRQRSDGPPSVWIYQPSRDVNRQGARPRCWVLEFAPTRPQQADPLMGWIGGGHPRQSVRLTFPTKAHALAFAQRQGWSYAMAAPAHGPATVHDLDLHRRASPSRVGLGQWHAVL